MIQIDMPMPDNCLECRFNTSEFGYCNAMPIEFVGQVSDFEEDGKPEWCPLKAQEPQTVRRWKTIDALSYCPNVEVCGMPLEEGWKYCPYCGQAVKWE